VTGADALAITLLTLKVGAASTALIALPGVAVGYALSRWRSRLKPVLQTLVALPMVLPPVAVGLLLLALLARDGPLGRAIAAMGGGTLLLTWQAAAIASAVMSFPLLVMGARQGFDAVPRRLEQVAATLGASRSRILLSITLPHAARGLLHGFLFAFARGLGEFGATALVAGDTPGETETLALGIYSRIQQFQDRDAALLAAISLGIALLTTGAAELLLRRSGER
jgi:molybdate transport system permease protein